MIKKEVLDRKKDTRFFDVVEMRNEILETIKANVESGFYQKYIDLKKNNPNNTASSNHLQKPNDVNFHFKIEWNKYLQMLERMKK